MPHGRHTRIVTIWILHLIAFLQKQMLYPSQNGEFTERGEVSQHLKMIQSFQLLGNRGNIIKDDMKLI